MAAKIWNVPAELDSQRPRYEQFKGNFDGLFEAENEYVKKVQKWAKEHGKGTLAGEIWYYPVGDGNAQYVVFKERPLELLWLQIGDAWNIPDIVRRGLRLDDVKQVVDRSKHSLFGDSRKKGS